MSDNQHHREHVSWSAKQKQTEKRIAYIFGLVFIVALLILAIIFPEPTAFQYVVFRLVLSLAAAGCASMIPGFIEVEISTIIRAGGALAVFVLVYFYNPASLILDKTAGENPWIAEIESLRGELGNLESTWYRITTSGTESVCPIVQKEASKLGTRFLNIQDSNLDRISKKIEKYRSAQLSFLLASDVECNIEKAKQYATEALQYGISALQFIEEAKQEPGEYGQAVRDWLDDDFTADRISYHNALAHSLLFRYGNQGEVENVKRALNEVREGFYATSGAHIDNNRLLQPVLEESPQSSELIYTSHPCKVTCRIK